MPYIGQIPSTGENNNFKILDSISSYTETFNGSSSGVVSVADDTLTFLSHRFITGQRITYSTSGTAIGGLVISTAYFVIKNDQNTIKLASTFANANNNVAIDLTALGTGTTHTLIVAFDSINTKFKASFDNGTKALITRAGQLQISINGVIQQPQDTTSPTNGFGIDLDGVIIFSTAPANTDIFWGNVFANNFATFDISDNTVDTFTGTGSQTNFTLSKIPANNQNILVTIDGVVQYPSDATNIRAYSVSANVITFVGAPGNATEIQIRHIGFAGATTSNVTGFYGRTGNVGLTTADTVSIGAATIGTGGIGTSLLVQGNARITGILTVGTGSITIDGVNNTITGVINTNATGISTVGSLSIGATSVISSARQLQNIASLDATTTATIESAVANAPNTFTDLNITGISTLGSATASSLVVSGITTVSAGSTSAPSISPSGDSNTGIFFPSADTIGASTGGTARITIDSSGNITVTNNLIIPLGTVLLPSLAFLSDPNTGLFSPGADTLALVTGGTNRVHVTSGGLVGIGTTPAKELHVYKASGTTTFWLESGDTQKGIAAINIDNNSYSFQSTYNTGGSAPRPFVWNSVSTEQMRIDSSGRLLVGTSTARGTFDSAAPAFQIEGTSQAGGFASIFRNGVNDTNPATFGIGRSRGSALGSVTALLNGDQIGRVAFFGADGTGTINAAEISAFVDGTPGANDMPGRLVFSTTADGSSSPTERMRIDSTGDVVIGKAGVSDSYTNPGISLFSTGNVDMTRDNGYVLALNRKTNDGNLLEFYQDNTIEGTISVSGTTVSYNGAHLSRWSQLPSGAERTEILRGTVLSNIDEMCGWGEEENEQLNRMKVSDIEGDKNVSGVFQAWDDDDDTYTNDFYCAMTGDFIIRIAEGVTIERGDLLMSAGDGTAKPQGDGFVQDKTIAKVTSNHVTCTYEDGSYCVPCVLMAC